MTNIFYVKVLQEEDKIALSVSVTQQNKNVCTLANLVIDAFSVGWLTV